MVQANISYRPPQLRILAGAALLGVAIGALPGSAGAADVVKFGAPLPLTGALSPEALKAKQGFEIWVDEVNKAGGIKVGDRRMKVEVTFVDYQSNTSKAVQATEGLITQGGVHFLFSPHGSGAAKAASNVSEKFGVPTVAATASSTQVFDPNSRYLFGTYSPNDTLLAPLFPIAKEKLPGLAKVAIYTRNDLFPLALGQSIEKLARDNGFDIVFNEKYAMTALDHSSALSQIKAAQPDWLFVTGYINDNLMIRKQMVDQRLEAPLVTMLTGPSYPEFVEAAGIAGSENITGASWWDAAVRYNSEDVFGSTTGYIDAFKDRFGIVPDYGHASYTVAAVALQLAIERAGTLDREAVREALAALDAETFFGPIRFNAIGQADSYKPPIFQIQDGKTVVLYPEEIRQGELRLGVK